MVKWSTCLFRNVPKSSDQVYLQHISLHNVSQLACSDRINMNNSLLEELCLLKQDQINNYFVVVYSPLFTGEYILCQLSVLDKTMINFLFPVIVVLKAAVLSLALFTKYLGMSKLKITRCPRKLQQHDILYLELVSSLLHLTMTFTVLRIWHSSSMTSSVPTLVQGSVSSNNQYFFRDIFV